MTDFSKLFDLTRSRSGNFLLKCACLSDLFSNLHPFLCQLGATLDSIEFIEIFPKVWAHKRAEISSSACILPPCIIDEGTQIRPNAYLRGGVLLGKNCVVGNATEIKNSLLFDEAKAPHFNYVGESILGCRAHLGAGVILSNVRLDGKNIHLGSWNTKLKKMGSLLGDNVEIGCNSVLNPGTVVGKNAFIYPMSCVKGIVPGDRVFKDGKITKRGYQV